MKRGPYKKATRQPKHRVNHQIRAPQVRLIGPDSKQVGVMSPQEALQKAKEAELDLVEIAPKAKPPVVKIIDYKKFQYLESKKLAKQKRASKKGDIKEIRLKPFMADGDFQVRVRKITKFLKQGNQVRISIQFRGRELAHKNFGYELFAKLVEQLGDLVKVDQQPKFVGRRLQATISPNK